MNEQSIVYQARLHWVIFLGPILLLGIMGMLYLWFEPLQNYSLYIIIGTFLWAGAIWFTYYFSTLTITQNQVILRTGVFVRQTIDIQLSKIESIDIRQSLLGSLLQYGTLVITGTGGTRQFVNYLDKPLTCRRYIEGLIHG